MEDEVFDEIVCAGISAVKWIANKDPESDDKKIKALEHVLSSVEARRFILISTIDVYPVTLNQNETFDCHPIDNHAYGKHRLAFEDYCNQKFQNCHIIRLPGLFGDGLKKNIIYDLMHDNCLDLINPYSTFQYYDLNQLWPDIQRTLSANVKLINFFGEPLQTADIIERFFPGKVIGLKPAPEMHYDLHTCHASLWGKQGKYLYTRNEVMDQLATFISHYKK